MLTIINLMTTDPAFNLAAEQYVFDCLPKDRNYFMLWQNENAVIIGKYQNTLAEINQPYVEAHKIKVVRRLSGGGAVYHDLGNLNYTYITDAGELETLNMRVFCEPIVKALAEFGVTAEINGRNDMTIDGKKFSGHAYYSSNGYNYHHGTIMMNVDGEDMPKYLRVSEAKLKSKGVASVRSRVTNLMDHIPEDRLTNICGPEGQTSEKTRTAKAVSAMQQELIRAAGREYGCVPVFADLPEVPEELCQKYSSEEWRYGTRIPFSKVIEHRFEWGGVEVQLEMRGEYISRCRLYSDSLETDLFGQIGELLEGCRYDVGEILGLRLPQGTSATGYEILELIASSIE